LSAGLVFGLIGGIMFGLFGVLVFSLIFGLIGGLQAFIKFTQPAYPLQPNQGIHATRRTMRRAGIPFAFINAAIGYGAGTLFGSLLNFSLKLQLNWPLIGLGLGLLGPLRYGGLTLWRHYLLRFRLSRQGVLPFSTNDRKLIAYLDDMVDHLLLRRVGGGWIFIHRHLQEHFAAQHPQAGEPLPVSLIIAPERHR
jgi:hypothetical protein